MRGMTIMELMVSVAILVVVGILVARFQANIFIFNDDIRSDFSSDEQARLIIRPMADEIRSASPSNLGAYPIVQAGTSTFTFYSDINNDGLKEEISYFISGNSLKKSVIVPSGNPYVYNPASQSVTTVVANLANSSSSTMPVFQYYDDSYTGTSSPLAQPVSALSVRLVQIEFAIAADANRGLTPRIVTTQVEIRDLKDNL